ncbi:MAG: UDP-N-acetylmuramoyl-L-alanyl-D-glutamate--2,6-diaminopimelate ligase [Ancalomicrobiaceae bacterium]|nr:UDP-N-acetylmuramoyl-L-alanyl-D-glutamate--2,6-diaminopimelate ligase [Ancalomicrobiaceae bacterium]
MLLKDVVTGLGTSAIADAVGTMPIAGISADSRRVAAGEIFVALAGTKADGARYVADAVAKGAAVVVSGHNAVLADVAIPVIRVDEPRHFLALASARLNQPFPKTVAAVTGTSGKTSIAAFLRQIWQAAGHRAASVGTIGIVTPEYETYGSLTTPDPVELAKSFAKLAREGITHVAMEASSHGLDQHRLDGIELAAGAFTNLSRDHLDYHPDVEAYFDAKMRLFEALLGPGKSAVVDVDTPYGRQAAERAKAVGLDVLTVGVEGATLRLVSTRPEGFAQVIVVEAFGKRHTLKLPLLGTFQVSNALVAAGLALATGIERDKALYAIEALKGAPGRLELVGTTPAGAPVFVDYSHKPDALEKAIAALRPYTTGRLVVVFGCGGDRDPGKRPVMGEIAVRTADVAIVTDDNPRSEDPAEIRRQILIAAPGAIEIGDRGEAIRAGVQMLRRGDILMIAGKGHETGQIVGDRVLPFSDHEAADAALRDLKQ